MASSQPSGPAPLPPLALLLPLLLLSTAAAAASAAGPVPGLEPQPEPELLAPDDGDVGAPFTLPQLRSWAGPEPGPALLFAADGPDQQAAAAAAALAAAARGPGRVKRTGSQSLSIVAPLDVLRQRLLLELGRRRLRESQGQIQANRKLLTSIGKRMEYRPLWGGGWERFAATDEQA